MSEIPTEVRRAGAQLAAFRRRELRRCARDGCAAELPMRSDRRYCSARCRVLAWQAANPERLAANRARSYRKRAPRPAHD